MSSWCRRKVCQRFSALADRTVTVSDGMAQLLNERLQLPTPPTVITNGVDVGYWAAPAAALPPGSPLRVVVTATLSRRKGHADALRSLAMLKDRGQPIRATIVGGGPEEGTIRRLIDQLGLGDHVALAGDLDRDGVRQAVHDAHLLLHPSHTESFGISVLEAMAAGRGVVAADCVGVRELVHHERTGLLTPIGDVDAIASALQRLIDDPALLERLAIAARTEAVDQHSHRRMAEAYERVADDLLGP